MWVFIRPTSQALRSTASGQVPSLSNSHATGRISFSANERASSLQVLLFVGQAEIDHRVTLL